MPHTLRRPLCLAGFSAFLGVMLAARAGPGLSPPLAIAAGALGIGALLIRPRRRRDSGAALALVCLSLSAALFLYSAAWQARSQPARSLDGVQATARMQIMDYPEERYHRSYYRAQVTQIDGRRVEPFYIRLSCGEPLTCRPYHIVQAKVVFYRFTHGGQFSQENAQLADGNALGAYLADYNVAYTPYAIWPPGRILAETRRAVARGISRYLPAQEAGLIQACLLGQRWGLPDACYDDFSQTGSAHLMSVSGLHMTAMALLAGLLIRRLPFGRWGRALSGIGALTVYLCVIGFPLSALRSCAMFSLYLLGQALGRKADSLNSLGGGVLAICLFHPLSGGDLGFCLSVTATAGIIALYGPLQSRLARSLQPLPLPARLLRPVCSALSISAAASAFSLPIQAEVFGGISLLNPLSTLLLTPVVTALLYVSAPLAALAPFPLTQGLARPFAFCAGWLARLALGAAHQLAAVPGGYFSFRHNAGPILAAACTLLALALLLGRPKGRRRTAAALTFLVLAGTGGGPSPKLSSDTLTLAVAGESDSFCVLALRNGHAAAFSLGGFNSGLARRVLRDYNITTLDTVFLPRRDFYAREMAASLLTAFPAGEVLLPQGAYVGKDLEKAGAPIRFVASGQGWEALPALAAHFSADTGQVSFSANGLRMTVETSAGGACGLRIAGQGASQPAVGLTVLFASPQEPLDPLLQSALSGRCLPIDSQTLLYLHILPDGSVSLERGS